MVMHSNDELKSISFDKFHCIDFYVKEKRMQSFVWGQPENAKFQIVKTFNGHRKKWL